MGKQTHYTDKIRRKQKKSSHGTFRCVRKPNSPLCRNK